MRFRYLADPIFLACVATFVVNKLVIKANFTWAFAHGYLNDCICIPLFVPPMLYAMRRVGLRRHDEPPGAHEILIPLLVWSWAFECYLPQTTLFYRVATADFMDVASYTGGALVAALGWHWIYRMRSVPETDRGDGPGQEPVSEDPRA